MRRIKPPSCPPWGMKGLALATWGSSWQSVTKEKPLQGGGGEGLKIRRIWVIRDIFLNMASEPKASEPKASERINGVLSSRQLSLTFLIPETSSRVTLAALGIGFQPKLPTTKQQNNQQLNNQQPTTKHGRYKFATNL